MTDQEKKFIQNSVDTIYMTFKSRVATGRKLDIAYVDSIGQGRVWIGTAGLKNGLVDALGGLDRAVQSAAAIAKIKEYKLITYPAAEDKLEKFMRMVQGNSTAEKGIGRAVPGKRVWPGIPLVPYATYHAGAEKQDMDDDALCA